MISPGGILDAVAVKPAASPRGEAETVLTFKANGERRRTGAAQQ